MSGCTLNWTANAIDAKRTQCLNGPGRVGITCDSSIPATSRHSVIPLRKRHGCQSICMSGGAEHAVLHLLYSRFWHKVLYDRGYVSTKEPFHKLVNQGMILGEVEYTGYKLQSGDRWVNPAKIVRQEDGSMTEHGTKEVVTAVVVPENQVVKKGDTFVLGCG